MLKEVIMAYSSLGPPKFSLPFGTQQAQNKDLLQDALKLNEQMNE